MERRSWSLMATANGIDRKRQSSLDREDTSKGCKRVCVEPFRDPMLASSSDFDNPCETKASTMHSYLQSTETASELINSLEAQSPTQFMAEQSIHDSAYLFSNHGQVFGADTGLSAQTLGPGPSTAAVLSRSQHDDNGYLPSHLNTHNDQIQQVNDCGLGWETDLFGSSTDLWANPAASLSHYPNSGPQEMLQYFTPVQSQSTDITCFPANVENSAVETGIWAGVSTEWTCMKDIAHLVEPESITNAEMERRHHSPAASESSITALDSGNLGKPLKLHGISSPSTNLLTELNAYDKVPDLESMIELPPVPQYDACFGVVIATAMSSFNSSSGTKQAPVSIAAYGDMLKLSFQDSNKYAGLITSSALNMLLKERCIQLNATLVASHDKQDQVSKKTKSRETYSPQECPVRIIVYGLASERVAVGMLLSGAGLYLQHPSPSEYDRHVEYINPHYLLRPGSHMPKLEQLSINSDFGAQKPSESLDEVNKSRFIRIFDLANEVGGSLTVKPSHRLRSTLQDHQLRALAMMSEKEHGILKGSTFPSLWEVTSSSDATTNYRHRVTRAYETSPRLAYGGILADEMGLGKTLSLLALICWSLDSLESNVIASNDEESRVTLIVATKSTIYGWQEQIERHIHLGRLRVMIYHGSARRDLFNSELQNVDIVLTTYETMRADWNAEGSLYLEQWHRIVLDEAHHIRTRSSQIFKAACAIKARHRWCLTGTPIHNSLDDYGALLSFVGIQPFTEKAAFDFWIANPVKQNRPNSLRTLEDLVRATCLRRTKSLNNAMFKLPKRSEKVEWIELFPEDRELYTFFKRKTAKIASELSRRHRGAGKVGQQKDTNILTLINFLRLICDHGEHLLPSSALEAWKTRRSGLIDWQMMHVVKARCDACGDYVDEFDAPASIDLEYQCQHSICPECAIRSQRDKADDGPTCPQCIKQIVSEGDSTISQVPQTYIRPSAKVEKLIQNLLQEQFSRNEGDKNLPRKSLVFSFWTKMLDLVQYHLELNGFIVQRIDGQSSLPKRRRAICQFSEDPKCTVMLASIGSAGEGVDLTAANHVHLLEPHWSPMAEAQAVDRVHRIGQSREVLTTRYITRDSIETYVQWVQKEKIRLIGQSLDSANISQTEIDEQRWKKLQSYVDCTQSVKR